MSAATPSIGVLFDRENARPMSGLLTSAVAAGLEVGMLLHPVNSWD
jgi:hypothetical protein